MPALMFYSGLFLVTSCTLMLQLIHTRILSVIAWYHLAFLAISMAMFGLTAGAVWVYLRRERFTEKTLSYDLTYFASAFALTTAVCLSVQMTLVPIIVLSVTSIWTWAELALCMAIPFFFSGVVVSLALTRSPFPIGRVYGADLLGAAAGCLGVLLILNHTDGPSAILWVGAIAAVGACNFSRSGVGAAPQARPVLDSLLCRPTWIVAALVAAAIVNGLTDYGLQPIAAKGKFEGANSHIYREWNSFSRVAVFPERLGPPKMWGPSPKLVPEEWEVGQRLMNIDGDAGTWAYRFSGDLEKAGFLRFDVTNLAYTLPGRERAAVIGVGAGRDVLSAAVHGFRDITGVEINPIFVKLLTREQGFADFTNLTKLQGIRLVVDEGRSWFARTDETFDVIQMSLIDTWAATGAGAFTLSENGLYTVQAWRIFLDRLSPDGVFTVSRWYNPDDISETGRILSLAGAALMEMGASEPRDHLFLAVQDEIATLVMSRSPLSTSDVAVLNDVAAHYEHKIIVSPVVEPASEELQSIVRAATRDELDRYTSGLTFDLTPPTDDRPFFFNQLPLNKPRQALRIAMSLVGQDDRGGVRRGNLVATATLLILFMISLGLVAATIVLPLRPAIRDVGRRLATGGTLYFVLIGIGFMMVEIGLLQCMSVFLGHPIYSLSVLLFTLICASGLGSLISDQWVLDVRAKFAVWAAATGAYIFALPLWLPELFLAFDSASLPTRAALCVLTITPLGLLLGFGFPTGMRLISAIDRRPTPWFWGVNGAAGVLASIVAVACSIAFGISATILVGAVCYLLVIPTAFAFLWSGDLAGASAATD